MGRHNASKEKLKNWLTAVFALISFSMPKTTNFRGLFLPCWAEPPCTPLGGDKWYDRMIFEPSRITMLSLRLFSVQRERERGARYSGEPLRQQHCSTPGKLTNHTPQNPTLLLRFPIALFVLFRSLHVIKYEGVCRLDSYTSGNSPPSSYSSSCPSRTLLSPSVTSRCDRLRPLVLCQDQYVWMLGKPLGHATEGH